MLDYIWVLLIGLVVIVIFSLVSSLIDIGAFNRKTKTVIKSSDNTKEVFIYPEVFINIQDPNISFIHNDNKICIYDNTQTTKLNKEIKEGLLMPADKYFDAIEAIKLLREGYKIGHRDIPGFSMQYDPDINEFKIEDPLKLIKVLKFNPSWFIDSSSFFKF